MKLSRPKSPDNDDSLSFERAKLSVVEFGAWIKNADTKATILAAGLGVMSSVVASQAGRIVDLYTHPAAAVVCIAVILSAIFIGGLAGAVICVFRVLSPRTDVTDGPNVFAWPSVAKFGSATASEFSDFSAPKAWAQAFDLAKIAQAKFAAFALALRWFLVTIAAASALVALSRIFEH